MLTEIVGGLFGNGAAIATEYGKGALETAAIRKAHEAYFLQKQKYAIMVDFNNFILQMASK